MKKSFMKSETLQELRRILIKNIKEDGKLGKQDFEQFTFLLDELLEIVHEELEKGKSFDDIKRTVVDFFTKKKEEVMA